MMDVDILTCIVRNYVMNVDVNCEEACDGCGHPDLYCEELCDECGPVL